MAKIKVIPVQFRANSHNYIGANSGRGFLSPNSFTVNGANLSLVEITVRPGGTSLSFVIQNIDIQKYVFETFKIRLNGAEYIVWSGVYNVHNPTIPLVAGTTYIVEILLIE